MFINFIKLLVLLGIPGSFLYYASSALREEPFFFAVLITLVLVFGVYWFSDKVALKVCRAELLTVYHSPTLFRTVEDVCKRADVRVPKVYMIREAAPNICSVARDKRHTGIVFTEGMLKALSQEELRSAIAHELVHIYRRDTQVATLAALFASCLGLNTKTARDQAAKVEHPRGMPGRKLQFVFNGILNLLAPIAALIVQLLVSMRRDYRADKLGAKLVGNPLAMANAIRTMEKKKHVHPMIAAPAGAHLFMVSPLISGRIERMFRTQPPMVKRIERLEKMHKPLPQTQLVVTSK